MTNEKTPHFYLNTFEKLKKSVGITEEKILKNSIEKCISDQRIKIENNNFGLKTSTESFSQISWNSTLKFSFYLVHIGLLPRLDDCDKVTKTNFSLVTFFNQMLPFKIFIILDFFQGCPFSWPRISNRNRRVESLRHREKL